MRVEWEVKADSAHWVMIGIRSVPVDTLECSDGSPYESHQTRRHEERVRKGDMARQNNLSSTIPAAHPFHASRQSTRPLSIPAVSQILLVPDARLLPSRRNALPYSHATSCYPQPDQIPDLPHRILAIGRVWPHEDVRRWDRRSALVVMPHAAVVNRIDDHI